MQTGRWEAWSLSFWRRTRAAYVSWCHCFLVCSRQISTNLKHHTSTYQASRQSHNWDQKASKKYRSSTLQASTHRTHIKAGSGQALDPHPQPTAVRHRPVVCYILRGAWLRHTSSGGILPVGVGSCSGVGRCPHHLRNSLLNACSQQPCELGQVCV